MYNVCNAVAPQSDKQGPLKAQRKTSSRMQMLLKPQKWAMLGGEPTTLGMDTKTFVVLLALCACLYATTVLVFSIFIILLGVAVERKLIL